MYEIAASGGEFDQWGSPSFHKGLDIRADPAPSGPFIWTVRAGVPILTLPGPSSQYNGVKVKHSDLSRYKYFHLDYNSIQQAVRDADDDNITLPVNSRVSQITVWGVCDYHHLHYETRDSAGNEDPVWSLTPRGDTTDPVITNLFFTENGSNTTFPIGAPLVPILSGTVDIIARAHDTQFGASPTGVMTIQYKVTNSSGVTVKTGPKIDFTRIPSASKASIAYRTSPPFESKSVYCGTESFYYVVTNMDSSGNFSEAIGWNTVAHPNGLYTVEVRAWDASFNLGTRTEQILIFNEVNQ